MNKSSQKAGRSIQREDLDNNIEIFSPSNEAITIKGTLFYHEGVQAWNTLRLKKQVLEKYKHLSDKNIKGIYLMKMHGTYESLKEEINKMQKDSDKVPILLFLGKEKVDQTI